MRNLPDMVTDIVGQAIRQVFAYDPEDEADAWWVQWGILQERAARTVSNAFKVEVKKLHNT